MKLIFEYKTFFFNEYSKKSREARDESGLMHAWMWKPRQSCTLSGLVFFTKPHEDAASVLLANLASHAVSWPLIG